MFALVTPPVSHDELLNEGSVRSGRNGVCATLAFFGEP
jgi:hypothetical protein